MPQIKKILFPVDFSQSSLGTARYVEAFAGQFEAQILLLHVVEKGERTLPEELFASRQARLDCYLADELKYFSTKRLCVKGDPTGYPVSDPAWEIVKTAGVWHPDIVMMPSHGLGAFRRLLLGSVTAKVLHDLDCPVWTSTHSEAAPPLEAIHCRRILCALDLGDRSQSVLEWAAWLVCEFQASLGIVHAAAELPPTAYGWNFEEEYEKSVSERAKRRIEMLQTATGATGQTFIKYGSAAKVVAEAAHEFAADLLVLGRHNGSGISGYLHPNAYNILRDSPCPAISI